MSDLKEILFLAAENAQNDILEHGEKSVIGGAAVPLWHAFNGLITEAGLTDEYKAFKAGADTSWDDTLVSVTLTNAEWSRLTSYLLMSTNYRKGEQEAWESLATETNEDGSQKFTNAPNNIRFWQETNAILDRIREAIDNR